MKKATKKSGLYVPPQVEVTLLEMEQCVATSANSSTGLTDLSVNDILNEGAF